MDFIIMIVYLAIVVLAIAGMWKTYEKLGIAGWKSIIPIYNLIVLFERFGWDMIKLIFFFIPIVNIYFGFLLYKEVAVKFGKGDGFAIGLLLLPFVFFPILGFKEEVVQE